MSDLVRRLVLPVPATGVLLAFCVGLVAAATPPPPPTRAEATVFRCPGDRLYDRSGHRVGGPSAEPKKAPIAGAPVTLTVLPWDPSDFEVCLPVRAP
jgi:hypothetical protein